MKQTPELATSVTMKASLMVCKDLDILENKNIQEDLTLIIEEISHMIRDFLNYFFTYKGVMEQPQLAELDLILHETFYNIEERYNKDISEETKMELKGDIITIIISFISENFWDHFRSASSTPKYQRVASLAILLLDVFSPLPLFLFLISFLTSLAVRPHDLKRRWIPPGTALAVLIG